MFRTLALETVGQQEHHAAEVPPLFFRAEDELVDDHLGRVGEVAELRLPEHQGVGIAQAIAVIEAQHARFGQRAVVNLDRHLLRREILQGEVAVAVFGIVKGRMPVAERAADRVLAR